jgi:putative tricarboxylic transport membrane protein
MIGRAKDFWSGMLFLVFGLGVLALARSYPFGTTTRMGPGFLPQVLAALLACLGLLIAVRSCVARRRDEIAGFAWKPLLLVLAATVLYGLLIKEAGFVAVTFACVLLCARASRHGSLLARLWLAAGTTLCCALIFVTGLGLPLPLLGSWFG